MKKITGIIIFTVFFISAAVASFGEGIDVLEIESVNSSDSTNAVNPGEYVVDDNDSTEWCLDDDETEGWVELSFPQLSNIYGVTLSGSLEDGDQLSIKYETDGIWTIFSPGSVGELDADGVYLDVSGDGVKTEKLRLYLEKNEISAASVEEVKIIGEASEDEYRKIIVESINSEDENMYYPLSNLADGNTRTYWKTISGNSVYSILQSTKEWLNRCFNNKDWNYRNKNSRWDSEDGVNLGLASECSIHRIKIYLEEDYSGNIVIKGYKDRRWYEIGSLEEGLESGWHIIDIEEGFKTDNVKLLVSDSWNGFGHGRNGWGNGNTGSELGGIGEIEFWGVGESDSGPVSLINMSNISLADSVNKQFSAEESNNYLVQLVLNSDSGEDFTIDINGAEVSLEKILEINGDFWYETIIGSDELWEDENFLRIPAQDEAIELVRAGIIEKTDNGILDSDKGVVEYFTGDISGYKDIVFDEEVSLEKITIFSSELQNEYLYYEYEQQWYSLDWGNEYGNAKRFSIYEQYLGDELNLKVDSVRITGLSDGVEYGIKIEGSVETDRAPEVTMYWPENGEILERSNPGFMFAVGYIDDEEAEVTINGIEARQNGNLFWLTNMPGSTISNDDNELIVKATDADGRISERTITWYDSDSSQYSVDLTEDIYYTLNETLRVQGRANHNISVYVNGEEADNNRNKYSKDIELDPGLNLVVVKFVQEHRGVVAMLQRRVVLVTNEPEIEIVNPDDNYYSLSRSITVSGSFDVMGGYEIRSDRHRVEISGNNFRIRDIRLHNGSNDIKVMLRDQFGRVAEDRISISCDTEAPVITGVIPASGSLLPESINTLVVTVEDESEVTVFFDGLVVPGSNGVYEKTIDLPDGFLTLLLKAKDRAGNITSDYIDYTVDTEPPLEFDITVTPPGWTSNTCPVISFTTTDAVSGVDHYELSIDEADFYTIESPYQLPELEDGVHEIVVRAVDVAGHIRYSSAYTMIDTIPPEVLEDMDIVPGNGQLTLKWEDGDDDVIAYEITRSPEWPSGSQIRLDRDDEEQLYEDTDVENGTTYTYKIRAVDRAENKSDFSSEYSAVPGIETEELLSEGVTKVEYDTAVLYLKGESLPEDAASVRIMEADPDWAEEADEDFEHDFVGSVYDFTLLDSNGDAVSNSGMFSDYYVGVLDYDPELIPNDFPEENISVYTFDTRWNRWVRLKNCAVDTENNKVVFVSNHFSPYAPAATSVEDISSEEIADAGYSPFGTYVNHEGLTVSPQGGNAHTSMTEFVLKGPNGFDFELKRYYDLALTKMDNRAKIPTWAKQYLENQGDYAYSMGKGWRLNLPYVKNATSEQYLVMPNGSMYGISTLDLIEKATTGSERVLEFENHSGTHFSLSVEQTEEENKVYFIGAEGYITKSWDTDSYTLTLNSGVMYSLDSKGRTTEITSPDGNFSITVEYDDSGYEIDKIVDAVGREIDFTYADDSGDLAVPYITGISIKDAPYSRNISYSQNDDGYLSSATDVGGRSWSYGYDTEYYVDSSNSVPFDLTDALEDYTDSDIYGYIDELDESTSDYTYKPLYSLEGPGKGRIEVTYEAKSSSGDGYNLRILARQVSIYDDNTASDDDYLRSTWYDYQFTSYNLLTSDESVYYISNTSVNELNDNQYTEYNFAYRPIFKIYWWTLDGSGFSLIPEILDSVGSRCTSVNWYEKVDNNISDLSLLKTKTLTYSEAEDVNPATKTVRNGGSSDYIRTSYSYDDWGNRNRIITENSSNGRSRKSIIYRKYSNCTAGDGASFKSYSGSGLTNEDIPGRRKNLVIMEQVANYVPSINSDGTAASGVGTAINQYKYYSYDDKGRMTGKSLWDSSNSLWNKTSFSWNSNGDLSTKVSADGHTTSYTYDSNHYLSGKTEKNVVDADGGTVDIGWTYTYDSAGWLISVTNPRGYSNTYTYDDLGRILTQVEPGAGADTGTYSIAMAYNDVLGSLSSTMTDSLGREVVREYNDLGQMVQQSSYLDDTTASIVKLTYDRRGKVVKMVNPNAEMEDAGNSYEYTTYYTYNALGRLVEIEYPYESETGLQNNPSRTMDYDYDTNELTIKDEEGNVITELYDMRRNVIERTQEVDDETITTTYWYDGVGKLLAVQGPVNDAVTTFTYNSLNQVVSVENPSESFYENGTTETLRPYVEYSYDEAGRRVETKTTDFNETTRVVGTDYDGLGRQIKIEYSVDDEILSETKAYYDPMGNPTKLVDPNGEIIEYTYTARNTVETATNPDDGVTSYTYYDDGLVKSVLDPRGNSGNYSGLDFTVSYEYDNLGRPITAELPAKEEGGDRVTISLDYDLLGNVIKQTGADGLVTELEYTPRSWVKKQTVSGDGKSYVTENEYDDKGNLVKSIDPRDSETVMSYDEAGRLVYLRSEEDNIRRYDYDEVGNLIESTWDKDGETIAQRFIYDAYSRMTTQYLPVESSSESSGIEMSYYYDRFGNLTRDTDALGNSNYYEYDDLNRMVKETSEAGFEKSYSWDDGGRLIESVDANGNTSSYSYSGRGLLEGLSISGPNGSKSISYGYDEAGVIQWATDGSVFTGYNGAWDSSADGYVPDVYGRTTSAITSLDGQSFETAYAYNTSDRIVGITAPDGHEVSYEYNLLGELQDIDGYLLSAPVYDEGGFLTSITAANGVSLGMDYDGEGKITERVFSGQSEGDDKAYYLSYDEAGNVSTMTNAEGKQSTYSYDLCDRLTSAYLRGSFGIEPDDTTNQETLSIEQDDVTGEGVLEEVEDTEISLDFAAGSVGVELNGSYKVARIYLYPDNTTHRVEAEQLRVFLSDDNTEGSYEEQEGFSADKKDDGSFEIILKRPVDASYVKVMTDFNERDIDFNPIDKSEFKYSSEGIIKVYHYLSLRLERYEYDDAGNRTNRGIVYNGSEFNGKDENYDYYPGTNRIISDSNYAYRYDANGNITAKGTVLLIDATETAVSDITDWSGFTDSTESITFSDTGELWEYEYDVLNRLIEVTKNGSVKATYVYDTSGLRVKKEKDGESRYFIFDINGNVIYEENTDETYSKYVYIGLTRFAREDGSTDGTAEIERYYYHTDHLGSTVMVTDEEANVVWDSEYTPFGELNDPYKTDEQMVQFTGKDMDFDTGLYYYNARWYDPNLGRFTTEDPIRDGMNYYAYVANNPLKYVDPSGLGYGVPHHAGNVTISDDYDEPEPEPEPETETETEGGSVTRPEGIYHDSEIDNDGSTEQEIPEGVVISGELTQDDHEHDFGTIGASDNSVSQQPSISELTSGDLQGIKEQIDSNMTEYARLDRLEGSQYEKYQLKKATEDLMAQYNKLVMPTSVGDYGPNARLTESFAVPQNYPGYRTTAHTGIDFVAAYFTSPFYLRLIGTYTNTRSNVTTFEIIGTNLTLVLKHSSPEGSIRQLSYPGNVISTFPTREYGISFGLHFHVDIHDGTNFYNPIGLVPASPDTVFSWSEDGGNKYLRNRRWR